MSGATMVISPADDRKPTSLALPKSLMTTSRGLSGQNRPRARARAKVNLSSLLSNEKPGGTAPAVVMQLGSDSHLPKKIDPSRTSTKSSVNVNGNPRPRTSRSPPRRGVVPHHHSPPTLSSNHSRGSSRLARESLRQSSLGGSSTGGSSGHSSVGSLSASDHSAASGTGRPSYASQYQTTARTSCNVAHLSSLEARSSSHPSLEDSVASFFSDGDSSSQVRSSMAGSMEPETKVVPRSSTTSPRTSTTMSAQHPKPDHPRHHTLEAMVRDAQASMIGDVPDDPDDETVAYEMEVSPGCYMPFRGARETWQAIDTGSGLESTCLDCGLELVSVPDCQVVVCPDCRMVNPIFEERPAGMTIVGVGIGFKKEWIA